nr:gluconeogenesis factor YvcK family protein [Adlercreutzia sp. ZJ304]
MLKKPFNIDPSATSAFNLRGDFETLDVTEMLERPVKAVVIGGGTGAPMSIRTLLSMGIDTSAVVAMADDGGSTGLLREKADVTPPGDIRKCITAFAGNPLDPFVRAFKYRLSIADDHALGNLILAALEDACGSFPDAISICETLVGAQGHVYPSTLDHVTLSAVTRDGRRLDGQAVACHSRTALEKVNIHGQNGCEICAYTPALQAIENADLIVLGPGSLFTSIIPNLLVPGITDAIRRSKGSTLFVCSLADMQGETWGLTAYEHVASLLDHGMGGLLDYVLVHTPRPLEPPKTQDTLGVVSSEQFEDRSNLKAKTRHGLVRPVHITYHDMQEIQSLGPIVIARDLADFEHPTWHSPSALRDAFLQVLRLMHARKTL